MSNDQEAECAFTYKTLKAYREFEESFKEEQNNGNEGEEDEDFNQNEGYLIDKRYNINRGRK